jgi:hypothetical protein
MIYYMQELYLDMRPYQDSSAFTIHESATVARTHK